MRHVPIRLIVTWDRCTSQWLWAADFHQIMCESQEADANRFSPARIRRVTTTFKYSVNRGGGDEGDLKENNKDTR